ncbi:Fpg/Nei family DNA glycosylase [Leekyejoonella antrihumi]|uniref:DNA-(apurinic or apyrimidinic site) lyase n=1 Tax=Leekyejoonella antrihumi TaxID=1660198 RepID=A0A563E525_9MICO|nr:DNA-formamidopyrimidine glycosylase family protein [Leekyejoonella antrihumi]TWP37640.1 Fpg/Nei family DNA glycosylase [Leekyejoonella antrihumi]
MPEGHTLRRLATALDDAFAGSDPRVSSPQGRFADGAALLDGLRLLHADSVGKQLFVEFGRERYLHVHLGLIGKFSVVPYAGALPPPVGQVRLRISSDSAVADLRGPTLCAVRTPEEVAAVIARLGPDPLHPQSDPERAWTRLHRSGRSIAELLMDQSVLAGVGNLYRCEVLFRHRVDPFRAGRQIRRPTWDAIWTDLVRLLAVGVITGRIVTDEDELLDLEERAARTGAASISDPTYAVYKRAGQACHVCGSRIHTKVVAGRNLFWCGRCQRRR